MFYSLGFNPSPVIASEAKQFTTIACMDCFASLAMTDWAVYFGGNMQEIAVGGKGFFSLYC